MQLHQTNKDPQVNSFIFQDKLSKKHNIYQHTP